MDQEPKKAKQPKRKSKIEPRDLEARKDPKAGRKAGGDPGGTGK